MNIREKRERKERDRIEKYKQRDLNSVKASLITNH